ncbi:MAG: hypothetical protein ACRDYC_01610, partial [Acidimicrobiales bacterium]
MALPRLVDGQEQEPDQPPSSPAPRKPLPREVLGRSTSDVVRLAAALAVAALAYAGASPSNVDALEVGIYRELRHVPSWLSPVSGILVLAGSVGAVLLAAGVAAVLRRTRLAIGLVGAGAGAYGLAHIHTWSRDYSFVLNGKSHFFVSSFPSDHMAVA